MNAEMPLHRLRDLGAQRDQQVLAALAVDRLGLGDRRQLVERGGDAPQPLLPERSDPPLERQDLLGRLPARFARRRDVVRVAGALELRGAAGAARVGLPVHGLPLVQLVEREDQLVGGRRRVRRGVLPHREQVARGQAQAEPPLVRHEQLDDLDVALRVRGRQVAEDLEVDRARLGAASDDPAGRVEADRVAVDEGFEGREDGLDHALLRRFIGVLQGNRRPARAG